MRGSSGFIHQQSVASLPEPQQDAAMSHVDQAVDKYPAVRLSTGQRLHVFADANETEWEVWLNCEDMDFTGICVAVARTRQEAVTEAMRVFEAAVDQLQQPPW